MKKLKKKLEKQIFSSLRKVGKYQYSYSHSWNFQSEYVGDSEIFFKVKEKLLELYLEFAV